MCELFGKGVKQRKTTVLFGLLTLISFTLGHASINVNGFGEEPIILWMAIVMPTGGCKSVFHQFLYKIMDKVKTRTAARGLKPKTFLLPDCPWEKMGEILANSGGRCLGLFDEFLFFFLSMNLYSAEKTRVSDSKKHQDFLQMYKGKPKTRETPSGNANFRMTQTSFTMLGFTRPHDALPIITNVQNNATGFASNILWLFPEPVFCRFKDLMFTPQESAEDMEFEERLVEFLTDLYIDGEDTYSIKEGDKMPTVFVESKKFQLSEEAEAHFKFIRDKWEMSVCKKNPHDALIQGLYSRGASHVLRLSVAIEILLSMFADDNEKDQDPAIKNEEESTGKKEQVTEPDNERDAASLTHEHNSEEKCDKEMEGESANSSIQTIGPQAIDVACSIVKTCLTQMCALNDKMYILKDLSESPEHDDNDDDDDETEVNTATIVPCFNPESAKHQSDSMSRKNNSGSPSKKQKKDD
ncbi:uncharacterized protein LOC144649007 [Oculina patagonica]